jgi:hypothetical protein
MTTDDLGKRYVATTPDDTIDPPRFGQPLETTKDAFVLELKRFFDREFQTLNRVQEIPTIRKFDVSFTPGESSLETAVKLIQKLPDINEDLPLIAVVGASGRNLPMGIGTQKVAPVIIPPFITSSNTEPFALADEDTLLFKTTDKEGTEFDTTVIFRGSRFSNIAAATAVEIVQEINFQVLRAKGSVSATNAINLAYGGIQTPDVLGDIEITGGTSLTALGFTIGQKAEYSTIVPANRYHQATSLEIAIEVATEDYNIRTELADLMWSFFTFYMDERDYTFMGRTIFDTSIPNETYQVIIKPDQSMAGEQEVPRPNDDIDKIYVNRINVPVTTILYADRSVLVPGTTDPFYIEAENIVYDETLPFKN